MKLLLQLSGEHPTLPKAELMCVVEGEGLEYKIIKEFHPRLILMEIEGDDPEFVHRLGLIRWIGEYLGSSHSLIKLATIIAQHLVEGESFRITCKSQHLQSYIGQLVHKMGFPVDLHNPDAEIHIFWDGEKYAVAQDLNFKQEFQKRRPHLRPYFTPTSLHPKLARAIVNLARLKKGDCILDPFCGTGGLLIEAGLMGMEVKGWDIDEKAVAGCISNLKHYGIEGEVIQQDATNPSSPPKEMDGVVTDLPYGRSSFTYPREQNKIYKLFFKEVVDWLKDNGRVVAVLPNTSPLPLTSDLKVIEYFDLYVHKSLTRRIWVLEKN